MHDPESAKFDSERDIFTTNTAGCSLSVHQTRVNEITVLVRSAQSAGIDPERYRYRLHANESGFQIVPAESGLAGVFAMVGGGDQEVAPRNGMALVEDILNRHRDLIRASFRDQVKSALNHAERVYDRATVEFDMIERRSALVAQRLSRMANALHKYGVTEPVRTIPHARLSTPYGAFRISASYRRDAYVISTDFRNLGKNGLQILDIQGALCVRRDGSTDAAGQFYGKAQAGGMDESGVRVALAEIVASFDAQMPYGRLGTMAFRTLSLLSSLQHRLDEKSTATDIAWKRLQACRRYHDEAMSVLEHDERPSLRP